MNFLKVLKGFKPLCFSNEELFLSKKHALYSLDLKTLSLSHCITLKHSFWDNLLQSSQYYNRLVRAGINVAVSYGGHLFVNYERSIVRLNLNDLSFDKEFVLNRGRGPLQFAVIEDIKTFEDTVYFGEYFSNARRVPVHVYRRRLSGKWETVYSFSSNEINHIHGLVPDKYNECIWILAGDFEHSAGIWQARKGFRIVSPVLCGSQLYRACVAFPTDQGLLYATDSQFEPNSIRLLKYEENSGAWKSMHLHDINGSCIYGCRVGEQFVFSTSSEPASRARFRCFRLLERKPGRGITKNQSEIVIGDLSVGFHTIYENPKDFLPYGLFQFGTIKFPHGHNPSPYLFSYNVANKYNDMATEVRII